jgi:hypothetical protein
VAHSVAIPWPFRGHSQPDAAIAYTLATLDDLCSRSGWKIDRVVPGLWSESPGLAAHEQDLVVLSRI